MPEEKLILDACCASKMFWFQKEEPNTLYIDKRRVDPMIVGKGKNARGFSVGPDRVMDFRKMDLENESFKLVVFDPPHFTSLGENSYMGIKYGRLDKKTWREDLRKGFAECFRVLKNEGVLIFKWNEHDIRLSEILPLVDYNPLFGHPSGKAQKTHWVTFMKVDSSLKQNLN